MKDEFKYIVFAFDTETPAAFKEAQRSDGMIFSSRDEANAYIRESVNDQWMDKFIVARLWADQINNDSIQLYGVDTVGFKVKTLKNLKGNQLDLFGSNKKDADK